MAQVNDLSRSLTAFDPISTLVVVVEMSKASWLVSGAVPGVERQPLKKLEPDVNALRHDVLSRYTVLPWERVPTNTGQLSRRPSMVRRVRPRSTSSRRSPASSGASAGFALLRLPRTGAGWRERWHPPARR